jgi:putative ABC transport system ATP-binding protein
MNAPTELAIRAVALTKRYANGHEDKTALRDVTFAIPAARFWVVSGPSGSGKTTLLGLLGGMIAPTAGEVHLNGRPLTHLRDHHRALVRRHGVGMVFQEFALVTGMSLEENLFLPFVPEGGPTAPVRRKAATLLERFGLAAFARTRVERLSAGERQRAGIIRALLGDAPVLLLDEPTASLDSANVERLVNHLADLRDEGRTLLATTHDPRLVDHPCVDGRLRLADGRLTA